MNVLDLWDELLKSKAKRVVWKWKLIELLDLTGRKKFVTKYSQLMGVKPVSKVETDRLPEKKLAINVLYLVNVMNRREGVFKCSRLIAGVSTFTL